LTASFDDTVVDWRRERQNLLLEQRGNDTKFC